MSMTKLQIGLSGALAIAGATGYVMQANTTASLRDEVAALQNRTTAAATLRAENRQLARTLAEVAELRNDTADFARMGAEASELRTRLNTVTRRQVAAAAASGDTYDVSKLDRLPTAVTRTPPVYPAEMRKAGIEGSVTVDFIVDKNGDVRNATAVKSTRPEFETSAVEAISGWKFEAGVKSGRAVNTHMQVPIVFALSQGEKGVPGEAVPVPHTPEPAKG
jgi:TonB family protein